MNFFQDVEVRIVAQAETAVGGIVRNG